MRTNDLMQIFRRLPPKVQLGVGALALIAFGVMWFTGTLPQDGNGNDFVSENRETNARTASERKQVVQPREKKVADGKRVVRPVKRSEQNNRPINSGDGDYDYFALALSWSPTYCETSGRGRNDPQCSGSRPYAFVLHGLWPQYEKGWPENCARGAKPWIPNDVIRSMLDIMPSRGLIIHEYKKHGTCTGLDAKGYYSLSRQLYGKVKIPPRYVRPEKVIRTSPREVENDFLKVNPRMDASMISIVCGRGERLKEIRICFNRSGNLARCGRNESQKKLCSRGSIRVPPVRYRRRS